MTTSNHFLTIIGINTQLNHPSTHSAPFSSTRPYPAGRKPVCFANPNSQAAAAPVPGRHRWHCKLADIHSAGEHGSEEELRAKVLGFIDHWNEHEAHPYKWEFRGDSSRELLGWALVPFFRNEMDLDREECIKKSI